ncbi:replication initiation protein [Streptomyces triticagri]|uniref:Replication initiation protein n=1 Tax=Streptomyces triticagri TaxID=2293568 RepID=A0A372LXW6_9ACTN|nr:replication initiator [Streptomyces triticagri]RFU82887.1 replication initiation protein [Streptomyces triticagri]
MPETLDLTHVANPAVRDLLQLVQLDDFNRVQAQVEYLAGCSKPIQLTGYSATLNAATGEALHVFNTDDEPTGRLLVSCGNRRASRCATCSRVYSGDIFQLIRAGLSGGKEISETVRTHPRVFATLTAPSFGPVHNRPGGGSKRRACRCGDWHMKDDPALGMPLDPTTYDYAGAVLWNAHASALWARFTTYLRREIAAQLGFSQRALPEALRISFAKVAEYQKRGLVHYHAVIRFDGPDGHTTPPPPSATVGLLIDAVRKVASRVSLTIDGDAVGEREFVWGRQIDVREVSGIGNGAELTDEAVAAYVAKYATKGAEDSGTVDSPVFCTMCQGRGRRGGGDCLTCYGTGEGVRLRFLVVAQHMRQMVRTSFELGRLAEFDHLKLWKWAHMLGFRGHFSTKSRRYSTTLGALRDVRRAWRLAKARAHLGLSEDDTDTTLVTESAWAFLGVGYSPGEELLAAQVRHDRAWARKLRAEGGDHG